MNKMAFLSNEELTRKVKTSFGRKSLNLKWHCWHEFPAAVLELTELKELDLSWNKLTTIPENVGELKNLTVLNMSRNQLSVFPESLTQLKKLKRLDILKNKLTTIPDAIGEMVRLEGLDLSYNQLKVLSPAIKQLKKLKKLSVRGNPFTVEGMRSVMELENKIYRVYSDVPDLLYEEGAKGSKAQLAYKRALKDGCVKVYRGRIILVGQDRAGKTSLKKSLLGLPFDPKEQSTEGIEVDPSKCEIAVDQAVKNWKLTRERKPGLLECSKDVARNVADRRCEPFTKNFHSDAVDGGKLELKDKVGDVFESKQV